jgi:hypothetical protein
LRVLPALTGLLLATLLAALTRLLLLLARLRLTRAALLTALLAALVLLVSALILIHIISFAGGSRTDQRTGHKFVRNCVSSRRRFGVLIHSAFREFGEGLVGLLLFRKGGVQKLDGLL